MGKINLDFTVFQRHDPGTGELETIIRKGSAHQTSKELHIYQTCIKAHTQGYKAKGNTPRERTLDVRQHLSNSAHICENINTKEELEKHLKEMGS